MTHKSLRVSLCGICMSLLALGSPLAEPLLLITHVPAYGSFENVSGWVQNVDPGTTAVAVFIYVPGYGWVSKPTCAEPLTPVQADGSWSADITTGGSDQLATRIAALLVSTNYDVTCVQGANYLPTNAFAQSLATAVITRQDAGRNWLSFSGYDWWLKSSSGPIGPGLNYFSDSTNNIWTDAQGQLHLRITNRSNQWQCAELVSASTFGYGRYRFDLDFAVNNLNPSVIVGLFTWSDDPVFANREMDIEYSRWANPTDPNNAQFVVQPFNVPGHLVRFPVPGAVTNVTAWFNWESNRVAFYCIRGNYSSSPAASNVISTWVYGGSVPQTGDENVRINLWLYNGQAPTDNKETEVILKSFQFVPLDLAEPALLADVRRSANGQVQFRLHVQPDRRYQIEISTNLSSWQPLVTLLATNIFFDFVDLSSPKSGECFYRALTLQ